MKKIKKVLWSLICAAIIVVPIAVLVGCGPAQAPPPPPPPPPSQHTVTHTPQQPVSQPTYRPSTEEWVHLPIRILYPSGGSRLDDQARAMLREAHSSVAHRTDIIRVRVEGHADGRGNTAANEQLGLERAQGVIDFMVGELGLPRELFEVHSYGETQKLTSGSTAADRVQNRRVEFSILVRRQAAL